MFSILAHILLISWPFSINLESKQNIHEIFQQVTYHFDQNNLDSVKLLAKAALSESKKNGYGYEAGRSLFFLGAAADLEKKPSQAIPYLLEALEQLSTNKTDRSLFYQAEVCVTLGKVFRRHQGIQEAVDFYQQGIEFAKASSNQVALRKLLYNLSVAHRQQGSLIEAIDALTQSMNLIPADNNAIKQRAYNQFGLIYSKLEEYDQARNWYNKMLMLEEESPSPRYYRGQAYHNLAITYNKQEDFRRAWKYFELAAKEKESLGNADKLFITYHDMAELALLEGDRKQASEYGQKALALIDLVPNTPNYYKIYKLLSQCEVNQNPLHAITYANQYMEASENFTSKQKELLSNGDRYKVQLIATNYFNNVKREKQRLKVAWTMSCAAAFVFLAIMLSLKLYRIYNYRSPELALSHIKNQNEMVYLLDLFRKEKEEIKNTLKQQK